MTIAQWLAAIVAASIFWFCVFCARARIRDRRIERRLRNR